MRLGLRKDPDWEYVGALLAHEDDDAQAAFFKGFVKEVNTFDTRHQTEMQLISVSNKLTDAEKETLSAISFREEP